MCMQPLVQCLPHRKQYVAIIVFLLFHNHFIHISSAPVPACFSLKPASIDNLAEVSLRDSQSSFPVTLAQLPMHLNYSYVCLNFSGLSQALESKNYVLLHVSFFYSFLHLFKMQIFSETHQMPVGDPGTQGEKEIRECLA